VRQGRQGDHIYDIENFADRYPEDPFFDGMRRRRPSDPEETGPQPEIGQRGPESGWVYAGLYRAWATQFNEVSIYHALDVRRYELQLLQLPGLRISEATRALIREEMSTLGPTAGQGQGQAQAAEQDQDPGQDQNPGGTDRR